MNEFSVETTALFEKEAKALRKKYPSFKKDIALIISNLKSDPKKGTPLGKNCFKIRFTISSKGKGKSGGGRIITCVKIVKRKVFLVTVYDKSDMETITIEMISKITEQLGL
jgi:hypothetical protein